MANKSYDMMIIDMINAGQRAYKAQPILLGGVAGAHGGIGGPPGGFVGRLIQKRVAYDTTEAATTATTSGGTLLDNLNHIRYRLGALETGSGITIAHNSTTSKQGGATGEYYHLDLSQYTLLGSGYGALPLLVYEDGVIVQSGVTILDFGSNITAQLVDGAIVVDVVLGSGSGTNSHFMDDLTAQVDGSNDFFVTTKALIVGYTNVYVNGLLQLDTDVTETSSGVLLSYAPLLGDTVQVEYNISGIVGGNSWNDITDTPTTLAGYGITDAYTDSEVYNKTETYAKSEVYVKADVYTKTELQTDEQSAVHWGNLTNTPTTAGGYGITDVYTTDDLYTKLELQTNGQAAVDYDNLIDTPTTLSGYGITDAYTKVESDARFAPISSGVGSIIWNSDYPPDSPSVYDDEFDDSSIDVKWTTYNPSGDIVISEEDWGLQAYKNVTALTGGMQWMMYQAAPSDPCAITIKVNPMLRQTGVLSVGAIFASGISNMATAQIELVGLFYGGDGVGVRSYKCDGWGSPVVGVEYTHTQVPLSHIRARYTGTHMQIDHSANGMAWFYSNYNDEMWFTPTHIGIGMYATDFDGDELGAVFNYMRYAASSDIFQVNKGKRG